LSQRWAGMLGAGAAGLGSGIAAVCNLCGRSGGLPGVYGMSGYCARCRRSRTRTSSDSQVYRRFRDAQCHIAAANLIVLGFFAGGGTWASMRRRASRPCRVGAAMPSTVSLAPFFPSPETRPDHCAATSIMTRWGHQCRFACVSEIVLAPELLSLVGPRFADRWRPLIYLTLAYLVSMFWAHGLVFV